MTTAPAFVRTGGTTSDVREVTLPEDRPGRVRLVGAVELPRAGEAMKILLDPKES